MFLVKFRPLTANTLNSLIQKTVKFSTVYELNDFNELNYAGYGFLSQEGEIDKDEIDVEIKTAIETYLTSPSNRVQMFRNAQESGSYCKEYLDKHSYHFLHSPHFTLGTTPELDRFACENVVYSNIGILSLSDISIFQDSAAQIMFAHYADNLKGIALIFEVENNKPHKIQYKQDHGKESWVQCYSVDNIIKWMEGTYDDMRCFTQKSKYWSYEKEYRLFNKPGLNKCENVGLNLKAILYTPRTNPTFIKTLNEINDKCYNASVIIEELIPPVKPKALSIIENKQKVKAYEWLEKSLKDHQ